MQRTQRIQALGLFAVIGVTAYFGLVPYARYGLRAGVLDEVDPFRIRHGAKLAVPVEDLHFGAVKDRIPPLDRPTFVSAAEAPGWLTDGARVLGIEHNGVAKAYPVGILTYHELINDEVGGKPYLVTY